MLVWGQQGAGDGNQSMGRAFLLLLLIPTAQITPGWCQELHGQRLEVFQLTKEVTPRLLRGEETIGGHRLAEEHPVLHQGKQQ